MALLPIPYAVDIGDRSVKLLQLAERRVRVRRHRPSFRIACAMRAPIPEGWIVNGIIAEPQRLAELIRSLLARACAPWRRSPFAVAALPDARTILTTIALPERLEDHSPQRLREAVAPLLPNILSLPADDAAVAVEPFPNAAEMVERALVTAAPATLVESYASVLESAGCIPVAVELGASAIARAVAVRASAISERVRRPVLILDLGATRTNAAIAMDTTVVASTRLEVSGDAMTSALATALRIDRAAAEELKRNADASAVQSGAPTTAAIAPLLMQMTDGVARILRFAASHLPSGAQPGAIVLTGGGAGMIGLDVVLRETAHLPVEVFTIPSHDGVRGDALAHTPEFTAAFGLALLAADPMRALV